MKFRPHFEYNDTFLFDNLLEEKAAKIKELKDAVNSEISLKLDYEHKYNEKLISPTLTAEVKEATGDSRPTAAMKDAYIVEQLKTEYDNLELAKNNKSLIRKDLELLDNQISLEKYVMQLILKEKENGDKK